MADNLSSLACIGAVKEVTAIELHSALVGQDLHLSTRNRLVKARYTAYAISFQAPIMVVASTAAELLIFDFDIPANSLRDAEVKWSTLNRLQFTRRDKFRADRHKLLGIDLQLVTENAFRRIARKVKEGVMGELSNGFSFNPSEYCDVVCAINDEDESTEEDLFRTMKSASTEFKRGNILVRTMTSNPHLYDWADIDFVFEIRIGALIYDAVRA